MCASACMLRLVLRTLIMYCSVLPLLREMHGKFHDMSMQTRSYMNQGLLYWKNAELQFCGKILKADFKK